jgi:hypothetical protein
MSTVSIAEKNTKLGNIPNISLLPIISCVPGIVCAKWTECYAVKFVKMYKNVRAAWKKNTVLAQTDIYQYFAEIGEYLDKKKPTHFRFHVGGDILNQDYFNLMCWLASEHPNTEILAFTKRFNLDYSDRPKNLTIMFSVWPTLDLPKRQHGIKFAFMQDGTETRIPEKSKLCSGKCEDCLFCWSPESDVIMLKH